MKTNIFIKPIFGFVFIFLLGCNGPEKKASETEVKSTDTTARSSTPVLPIINLFKKQGSFPFLADTSLMYHLDNLDSLGTNEVKILTSTWFKHDLAGGSEYNFRQFYRIDSVKAIGKYDAYCDSLQLGDTKNSNAYAPLEKTSAAMIINRYRCRMFHPVLLNHPASEAAE